MITKITGILMGLMFILGIIASQLYFSYTHSEDIEQRILDGLRIGNADYSEAKEITRERDVKGDWVCVNVKGMEYERAVEVCNHEVGHEIFAEVCEKNMEKCLGVINE